MKRLLIVSSVLAVVITVGLQIAGWGDVSSARSKHKKLWTKTKPAINVTHIFYGEINRSGKPTGFHARPKGKDPEQARLVKRVDGPNEKGVYVARVEIHEPKRDQWLEKRSSMFPDTMSPKEVINAVLHAFRKGSTDQRGKFRGPSGLGFTIEGWTLRDGRINTAYPIYRAERRR